jgi:GAF domain-containing protein
VVLQAGELDFPSEIPIHESSLGVVIEKQQAIEVEDAQADRRYEDLLSGIKDGGFRSFRIVPLTTSRQRLGIIAVLRQTDGAFS